VKPRLYWLEIDITYACGMDCLNCNRMTGIAPGRPEQDVTVAQIDGLINDSVRLKYPWRKWFLVGGEPTTHPELHEILDRIRAYRTSHRPRLEVTLATHGCGEPTQTILDTVTSAFPFLTVLNSHKTGAVHNHFIAPCAAPTDRGEHWASQHVYKGCHISRECGIGMTYQGFYPCAIAGAIDRIFALDQGIASLEQVSRAVLIEKYQVFCRLCGHYRPMRDNSHTLLSPVWQRAIERYSASKREVSYAH